MLELDGFHSKASRKDTLQTLSSLKLALRRGDSVLDVGCGAGYVVWKLSQTHDGPIHAVDIVDVRRKKLPSFQLYDGTTLPFADDAFDVILLAFVLHHVPNQTKPAVLGEIHRVTRRSVVILEDTPRNFIDRYYNRKHGEEYRKQIGSTAGYGFYTQREWEQLFAKLGFTVERSQKVGRFARDVKQPYARSCFVLRK